MFRVVGRRQLRCVEKNSLIVKHAYLLKIDLTLIPRAGKSSIWLMCPQHIVSVKLLELFFPPLLDTELVTRLFGWSVHVHSFIVGEFPYCYFLVFTLNEYFWASFPSIAEVIWFRVGSACLDSHGSTTWAYLGLYKEVRTLTGAWGLHSLAAFAFLIFVKDFHWKTQKFGGKLAKIVLPTFWNFKETDTHNT